MLIELLSMANYGNYNIKLAHILGLEASIYLNELMNINEKALRKKKLTDNAFVIDRDYIESRTTLNPTKQQELESTLIKLGILEIVEEANNINLNISALTAILAAPEEDLKSIEKIVKKTKSSSSKTTKQQQCIQALKQNIVTTNDELVSAYHEWIEAVVAKNNWMAKKAVVNGQQLVDDFSQRNLDIALKLLDIATTNGWADMSWAINSFKRNYNISYQISTPSRPVSMKEPKETPAPTKVRLSQEVF